MKIKLYLIMLFIFCSGCAMLKNSEEYELRKEIRQYLMTPEGQLILNSHTQAFMDKTYHNYAERYHDEKVENYRKKLTWALGLVGSTLGIVGTAGGLVILNRKLKKKNEDI